jgi:hypothetical protein
MGSGGRRRRGRPRSLRSIAAEAVAALVEVERSVDRGVIARAERAAREARSALGIFLRRLRELNAGRPAAMA